MSAGSGVSTPARSWVVVGVPVGGTPLGALKPRGPMYPEGARGLTRAECRTRGVKMLGLVGLGHAVGAEHDLVAQRSGDADALVVAPAAAVLVLG